MTDVVVKILPSSHSSHNEGGRQRTWLGVKIPMMPLQPNGSLASRPRSWGKVDKCSCKSKCYPESMRNRFTFSSLIKVGNQNRILSGNLLEVNQI